MKKKIGFIGVGRMGKPMAKHLLAAGFPLTVYQHINPKPVTELKEIGASVTLSLREIGKMSDVVISMLPGPSEVIAVYLGKGGVLEEVREGTTIILMETMSPSTVKNVADCAKERGVNVLGASVSGGPMGAEARTLTIMVGGEKDVFDECLDVFKSMGEKILYMGPLGSGNVVKLVNNLIWAVKCMAICEGFVLGVKAGIDPDKLYKIISSSTGTDWYLENWFTKYAFKGKFEPPGSSIDLALKDLECILDLGRENKVPLPVTGLCHQIFMEAAALGKGKLDWSSIITLLEDKVGVKVRIKNCIE